MARLTLEADLWDGVFDRGETIENPTSARIREAIEALDGRRRTMITLCAEDGRHLVVAGGARGMFICYCAPGDDRFLNLVGDQSADGRVLLVAGGQEGAFDATFIVDAARVVAASAYFAEHFAMDPALTWAAQA